MVTSRLCWLCIKEAAEGTFNRANAVATILGGIILWLLTLWLGGMKMEAPTSVAGTIGFAVVLGVASLGVSWIVIFLWRLIGAPARLYTRLADEKAQIERELEQSRQRRATLEVKAPYKRVQEQRWIYWQFALHNRGPAVAENVIVRLGPITPEPQNVIGLLDFPLQVGSSDMEVRINIGSDVRFDILRAYREQDRWQISSIGRGNASMPQILVEQGQFEFSYRAQGANADEIIFAFIVTIDGNDIQVVARS
jgi:hypothetical protein